MAHTPRFKKICLLKANKISFMILACDANGFTPASIDLILSRAPVPVFGGVFPAIIHGREMFKQGSLVIGLPKVLETRFICS